jgi:hypothetical protein
MNSLIEVTQTVLFTPVRLLGQVEYSYSASSQGKAPGPLFYLAFTILMLAAWWKIFTKAGQPGWACIIPNLQSLRLVQDRRAAVVVDSFDANSFR